MNPSLNSSTSNPSVVVVHFQPVPGTWSYAIPDAVLGLGGTVVQCGPTSFEVSGSHLDARTMTARLSESHGECARVHCFEVVDGWALFDGVMALAI